MNAWIPLVANAVVAGLTAAVAAFGSGLPAGSATWVVALVAALNAGAHALAGPGPASKAS